MKLRPSDTFNLLGIRLAVKPEAPWWPGLRWLQAITVRWRPAIPKGTLVELTVNGKCYMKVPASLGESGAIALGRHPLKIRPRDEMRVVLKCPRGMKATRRVSIMLDGVLVRAGEAISVSTSNPEGA